VPVARSTAGQCSRDPDSYPLAEIPLTVSSAAQRSLRVEPQVFKEGEVAQLVLRASVNGNMQNQCAAGKPCVISWQAFVDTPQGTRRLFIDAAVRNRPAEIVRESQLCLPANAAGRLHVLAKDSSGQTHYVNVPLQ
jgi:hypothetical protein